MPGIMLAKWRSSTDKKDKHPCLHRAYVLVGKDNKYMNMSNY